MKTLTLKLLLLIGGPLFLIRTTSAQTVTVNLPAFETLMIEDRVKVTLKVGETNKIELTNAPESSPEVLNNMLRLESKNIGKDAAVTVYVTSLKMILTDDVSQLVCEDTLRIPSFAIETDGASKAEVWVVCNDIKMKADGSSSLTVKGSATQSVVEADGVSKIHADGFTSVKTQVTTDGSASAKVFATEQIHIKADGASSVKFNGNPKNRSFLMDGLASASDVETGEKYGRETIKISADIHTSDTTKVKLGKRKFIIIEDDKDDKKEATDKKHRMKGVWGGFELGVQGFTTPSMNFNMPASQKYLNSNIGSSWFFALNTPDFDAHIIKNKLAFTSGLGIVWNNIHFDGNEVLIPNADSLGATPSPAGINYSLNKLYTFDITAPLMLKFAPGNGKKQKKGFHIAAGGIVHYVVTSRVVTETTSLGYLQTVEMDDDFNINPFRVDATVRVGYNNLKLFANYSLTPYFNSAKAPDVRLFSAGITLIGF